MPRRARMYIPGLPFHIVQRGNNREACFFAEQDYLYYLELLEDCLNRYSVSLHAYVLMTNHVHLLLTPSCEKGISRLMSVVASRYGYYMNKTYARSGTVWEGRHKASAVDCERYLFTCYRYIEMNPVTAGMVKRPEEYRWSSYGVNAWDDSCAWLTPHEEYLRLGSDNKERTAGYRDLFNTVLLDEDLHAIRKATHYSHPLGDARFCERIASRLSVPVGYASRGRPKKVVKK
ncbi:MAG TPA: transposase [Pseudomonadales bacterium]|nr:transposase [Pseudomonadales bacterium]